MFLINHVRKFTLGMERSWNWYLKLAIGIVLNAEAYAIVAFACKFQIPQTIILFALFIFIE